MFQHNNLQGKTYSIKNAQVQYQLQLYYLKFATHKTAKGLHTYWPNPEQKENQYWRYSTPNIVVVLVNIHMNWWAQPN